jgi:glutathione S-transferase
MEAETTAVPVYKLYSPPGSFRAFATLVAAEYNGISIHVVTDTDSATGQTMEEAVLAKSPTGKAPILECPDGQIIFSSHAMARFVTSLRTDSVLLGSTTRERMAMDEWMDWAACEVELPACVWFYPVAGIMPHIPEATAKAKTDFAMALQLLETYLSKQQSNTSGHSPCCYLVKPHQITLADIVVVSTLLYPFKLVCDETYLKPYPNVVQWFLACINQPQFVAVVGKTELYKKT